MSTVCVTFPTGISYRYKPRAWIYPLLENNQPKTNDPEAFKALVTHV